MLRCPDELSEAEAWALVSKAASGSIHGYKADFERLPPTVQKAVGSPEMLHAWGMMNADAFESVVASNFQRSYRTIVMRERVRSMVDGIADRLMLQR